MSRAEREPTEVGDVDNAAKPYQTFENKGDQRSLAYPHRGEGCGDTLSRGSCPLKWVRR